MIFNKFLKIFFSDFFIIFFIYSAFFIQTTQSSFYFFSSSTSLWPSIVNTLSHSLPRVIADNLHSMGSQTHAFLYSFARHSDYLKVPLLPNKHPCLLHLRKLFIITRVQFSSIAVFFMASFIFKDKAWFTV